MRNTLDPRHFIAVAAGLSLSAAGCTDEPGRPAAPGLDITAIEACELLAPEPIAAATGITVDAGRKINPPGGVPMCNWSRAGSKDDVVVTLLVAPSSYDDYDDFLAALTEGPFGAEDAAEGVEAVTGAGRFGAWMPEATMLQAYDEDVMVQVDVTVAGGIDALDAAQALARQALGALR